MSIKQGTRIAFIYYVISKNGLDRVLAPMRYFFLFRLIGWLNPLRVWRRKPVARGEAIRKTLEDLGPVFVKFGQALSTRPDLLPSDINAELRKLQDNVPPFSSERVLSILEKAFGRSAHDVFREFDETSLGSASMAQVHAATLVTGEDVVVKVLRPNMRKIIKQDVGLLRTMAQWAERYWSESRRFKPVEVVNEFEQRLLDELDMQREAANATQLRRNFKASPLLYVPEIYWDYVRNDVLVMERIYGIPVADVAQLDAHAINRKVLAERGVEIFFTQVFRDCFFHADMHPGNIFVSPQHPHQPQYMCVDFGIMGTLNERDQRYLAENLMAFFHRDYRRVAALHIESGWVSRHTRQDEFESAIRTVCEPIFEKPLKDISFALIVLRLFQVARRFQMEVQPQLILLQKTLFAVEGLGRQIYPDLDLWATAKPFLERWMCEQRGPLRMFKQLKENLPFFIEQLPSMPKLLNDVLLLSRENGMLAKEEASMHKKAVRQRQSKAKNVWFGFVLGVLVTGFFVWSDVYVQARVLAGSILKNSLHSV